MSEGASSQVDKDPQAIASEPYGTDGQGAAPPAQKDARKRKAALMDALRKDMKHKGQATTERDEGQLLVDNTLVAESARVLGAKGTMQQDEYVSKIAHLLLRIRTQLTKCHTFLAHQYANNRVLSEFVTSCIQDINGVALVWLLDRLGEKIDVSGLTATFSEPPPISKHMLARMIVLVPTDEHRMAEQARLAEIWGSISPVIEYYKQISAAQKSLEADVRRVAVEIAPNLVSLCGSEVAGVLLGLTGGIASLGKLVPADVMNLGASYADHEKSFLQNGPRKLAIIERAEFLEEQENDQDRKALARSLASKIPLAARVDAFSDDTSTKKGAYGEKLRTELLEKVRKRTTREPMEEPALPRPEARETAKRGGWKARLRRKRAQELAQVTTDASLSTVKEDVATSMDWYD
ncbi:U4/U6 snRNP-associated 61 kDa protein [Perkinsela sp. CCAP 1560/4]|nr:U4/U6 snRNP-associated 61 kDa protein [Perkinsela sp. CCAP 1560/4]|eukprot:KNH03937.1 U4/U6 snRNP-associated 61 kDa protein [Perkinsela sp. CCAP 1560/4]